MADRDIQFFLSGGGANIDPNLSLGGLISTTEIFGNNISFDAAGINGVTLIDSIGSITGASGLLKYFELENKIGYQKEGGALPTALESISVPIDGDYVITCPELDASVSITVVAASLPVADSTDTLSNVKINPNLFSNVPETESTPGSIKYRHLYLFNKSGTNISARVYIPFDFTGEDTLAIGFLTTISGSVDTAILDEDTAPAFVVFNSPATKATAELLTINAGEQLGVFLKRQVAVLSDSTVQEDTAGLVVELE